MRVENFYLGMSQITWKLHLYDLNIDTFDFKMDSAAKLTTFQFPEPIGAGSLIFSEQYLYIE